LHSFFEFGTAYDCSQEASRLVGAKNEKGGSLSWRVEEVSMNEQSQRVLSEAELTELATTALVGLGLTRKDAADAARVLTLAEMFGLSTHGVGRIESYGERLQINGINPRPSISLEQIAPALIRVDGDNGVGPLVGMRALEAAMKAAATTGVALALARGSNHFGPVSPYSYIAAEAGFASLIGSNATTTIAPWGGSEAHWGMLFKAACCRRCSASAPKPAPVRTRIT
jgi:ureidoglycolate dehydrogenase (NAD+)